MECVVGPLDIGIGGGGGGGGGILLHGGGGKSGIGGGGGSGSGVRDVRGDEDICTVSGLVVGVSTGGGGGGGKVSLPVLILLPLVGVLVVDEIVGVLKKYNSLKYTKYVQYLHKNQFMDYPICLCEFVCTAEMKPHLIKIALFYL